MDVKKENVLGKKSYPLLEKIRKEEKRRILKDAFEGAVYILISFFLGGGETLFGATPFGFALMGAASSKIVYIYIGLCLSALFGKGNATVLICSYSIVILLRIISRIIFDGASARIKERKMTVREILPMLFEEHILLRITSAAIGAFTLGVYTLVSGGFFYHDLFGAILNLLLSALLTFIFNIYLEKKKQNGVLLFLSFCVFAFCVVLSLGDVSLLGVSLAPAAALAITLYISQKKGIVKGVTVGMCVGLAISIELAPAFIFAAAVSAMLCKISVFFASSSAALVAFAWGLFASGISALAELMPAFVLVFTLYSAIDKLYLTAKSGDTDLKKNKEKRARTKEERSSFSCAALRNETLDGIVLDDTESRIKALCESFTSLSSLFFGLSERLRVPSLSDAKGICDAAFDAECSRCERREECWEKNYSSSSSSVSELSSVLVRSGRVSEADIPKNTIENCKNIPSIIERINKTSILHTQELLIGDKTEIFALDYEAVSELLAGAMVDQREEFEPIDHLTEMLSQEFSKRKMPVSGVIAFGTPLRRAVIVRGDSKRSLLGEKDKILSVTEAVVGNKMRISEKNETSETYMLLTCAERLTVEYEQRKVTAEGEEGFCGDSVSVFSSNKGKFYSLISDGMGAGREAALTSGIASVFLTKMLGASAKCDVTLKMLGSFLRNKGSGSYHECSATVDLLELNTVTGEAAFYKAGAAPSYVWRDKNLFKLRSNTVPLGIIKEVDVKRINFEVEVGDVVIMVSDGVTMSRDECPWLFELLSDTVGRESLAAVADMIVKRAKYEGATDDISVVVMKINEV